MQQTPTLPASPRTLRPWGLTVCACCHCPPLHPQVLHSWVASSAACLAVGFLLGRYLPRGGDGNGRSSGGGAR